MQHQAWEDLCETHTAKAKKYFCAKLSIQAMCHMQPCLWDISGQTVRTGHGLSSVPMAGCKAANLKYMLADCCRLLKFMTCYNVEEISEMLLLRYLSFAWTFSLLRVKSELDFQWAALSWEFVRSSAIFCFEFFSSGLAIALKPAHCPPYFTTVMTSRSDLSLQILSTQEHNILKTRSLRLPRRFQLWIDSQ